MAVYEPKEDSYFFSNFLEEKLSNLEGDIEYLDMGTGSGILAETANKFLPKSKILTADINQESVKILREKGFNSIQSNLFENINAKFDLITFNAPYLPEDNREPKDSALATTGGKKGDEISIKFIQQAKKHLNPQGKIFLLISSLTPNEELLKLGAKEIKKKKISFEELIILEF